MKLSHFIGGMLIWAVLFISHAMDFNQSQLKTILDRQAIYEFQQGNISLFDAIDGNNLCHIHALIVAKLYQDFKQSLTEDIASPNLGYLRWALLFSSAWLSFGQKTNLAKRIKDTLNVTLNEDTLTRRSAIHDLTKKDKFSLRLLAQLPQKDKNGKEIDRIWLQTPLELLTATVLGTMLKMMTELESSSLTQELQQMTASPFLLSKFISSLIFIEQNKIWKIPLVLRVKHICSHGTTILNFVIQDNIIQDFLLDPTLKNEPIIVIDAASITWDTMLSKDRFIALRKKCLNNFKYFDCPPKNDHSCINCNITNQLDCKCINNFRAKLIGLPFEDIFYALGADFTQTLQAGKEEIYTDYEEFENINQLYNNSLKYITQSVCSNETGFFFIEHMYPDLMKCVQGKRLVDKNSNVIYKKLSETTVVERSKTRDQGKQKQLSSNSC